MHLVIWTPSSILINMNKIKTKQSVSISTPEKIFRLHSLLLLLSRRAVMDLFVASVYNVTEVELVKHL